MLQSLITGLILLAATGYLSLRYLPAELKKSLRTAVGKRSARLAAYFAVADGACGSGCGSCNSCEPTPLNASPSNTGKIIPIVASKKLN